MFHGPRGNCVNILLASLFLCAACKSTPKKEETAAPPPAPVVAAEPEPVVESAIAKRLAEMEAEEEMVVAVRPELAFRETPRGKVIGGIPYGTKITVLDRSNGDPHRSHRKSNWFKIKYKSETGYVFAKYLRKPGETKRYTAKFRKKRRRR